MQKIRGTLINLTLLSLSLGMSILLIDLFLRVLPPSLTGIAVGAQYEKNELIGYNLKPSVSQGVVSGCFSNQVSSNSLGFRGGEWEETGGIAILGDSYVEAIQVADAETLSSQLSDVLNVPVYNAGLSSFGTVAELLVYRSYIQNLKPRIVVLAMFENDILDNHCSNAQVRDGFVTKPCATLSESSMTINTNYYSTHGNVALRSLVKKHCLTCNILRSFFMSLRDRKNLREDVGTVPVSDFEDVVRNEAWQITGVALNELKSAVEGNGSELIVMVIPDLTAYYEQETTDAVSTEIVKFVKENGIRVLDLRPLIGEYIKTFSLPQPFLSYACDGHWNPLGHYLGSRFLAIYLIENDLITTGPTIKEEILKGIGRELQRSPEEILGIERFKKLYVQ